MISLFALWELMKFSKYKISNHKLQTREAQVRLRNHNSVPNNYDFIFFRNTPASKHISGLPLHIFRLSATILHTEPQANDIQNSALAAYTTSNQTQPFFLYGQIMWTLDKLSRKELLVQKTRWNAGKPHENHPPLILTGYKLHCTRHSKCV